jgi:hypothetical protein
VNIGPIELLIVGAIVVIVLALGMQPPAESTVARWLVSYEAPTDDASRSTARGFLTRAKRSRFGCAFVLIVLYSLIIGRSGAPAWANTIVVGLAGYLVGAIAAEVFRTRPSAERFAGAMLSPRTLATYVHRTAIVGLVLMPAAAVVVALLYRSIEPEVSRRFGLEDPAAVMGAAAFGVAVAVVVWIALRALVRRPQPTSDPAALTLDDAMRASSAHALAGAALALEWLLLAFIISALQHWLSATGSRFAGLASFLIFLSLGAAFASWAIIGHPERWRSRRPVPIGSTG